MPAPSKLILTPTPCFSNLLQDNCYGSLKPVSSSSPCGSNLKRKCTKVPQPIKSTTYQNIMTDPRVRRGSYIMHLPCREAAAVDPIITYASCFEMVKKDPLCQLYLRGLQKCGKKVKRSETSLLEAKQRVKRLSQDPDPLEIENQVALLRLIDENSSSCQTEEIIEVFQDELEKVETCMQTEPLEDTDVTLLGLERHYPKKKGVDRETQIEPGDRWSFKEMVKNFAVGLGLTVTNEALLELMEEHELDALRKQQAIFLRRRRQEAERLMEWIGRDEELKDERARLEQQEIEKYKKDRLKYFADNCLECDSAAEEEEEQEKEKARQKYMEDLQAVVSGITQETSKKLKFDSVSRELVDDIILQAALDRIFYGLEEGL